MDKRETKDEAGNMNEETASAKGGSEQEQKGKDAAVEMEEIESAAKLREELESAKDKYIRLYSEFENYRRRTSKEKGELILSANEQLIKSLIPVVDDFDRAEGSVQEKTAELEGFLLIHSKLRKVLELYGVKPMDARQGSEFDADFHEAISQVQAPQPELKGKIIDVVEKGYLLNDKVIRYAKVVVGN